MKLETELPALPKEHPKKPVDEEFDKLKEEVEKKIMTTDEEIKEAIRVVKDLRKGLNEAPSVHDTPEIKLMKQRMGKLREEKKQLHDASNGVKNKMQELQDKINVITAPKDKLPKSI